MVEDVGWIFKMLIPRGSGGFAVFVHGGERNHDVDFLKDPIGRIGVCVCVYLAGENLLCPEMEVEKAPLIRPDGGYACTYGKSWGEEILYGWVCRGHTSSAIFDPSLRPFI